MTDRLEMSTDPLEKIEAELAEVEAQFAGYVPKHKICGGACHRCPDLNGEIMPGCDGGLYDLDGCYCRPDKVRVRHPKCPTCRCPEVAVEPDD